MNGLKINQKILADSTSYFYETQIVELCPTTLKDARNTPQGIQIDLGGGHSWGCIYSRNRDRVIANKKDLAEFFKKKIDKKKGLEDRLKEGKSLLRVYENKNNGVLYVVEFKYAGSVDSLKDGKYTKFKSEYEFISVRDKNIPKGFYDNIDETFKVLNELVVSHL